VLSRFEGFPTKKLEAIRMAAALYNKLNSILSELQNWKVESPMGQLLDKVERYFNKVTKNHHEYLIQIIISEF
jgi:Wiskott-Aldrich syndrome protein